MGIEFGTIRAVSRELVDAALPRAAHAGLSPATEAGLVDELARVAAAYEPRFGSMAAADVARGRALVQDTLADLQLVPVVNRWRRPGVPVVEAPDAFMGTVHTLSPRHAGDHIMRAVRERWETARNFHGPGELAGRTVFASGQFVPTDSIAQHGGDVAAALAEQAAARGATGVARFGNDAHVLDPAVLARASVTGRDSGLGPNAARPATLDRLHDAVLERLAASHGFRRDPFLGANDYRIGIDGAAPAAARRDSFRTLLHDTPDDIARQRLREYLTGPTMTDIDHMVEVQVRGVRGRDILATVDEPAASGVNPVGV